MRIHINSRARRFTHQLIAFLLAATIPTLVVRAAPGQPGLKVDAVFAGGRTIDAKFSCDGADVSPALRWSGAPSKTKTLAVVVVDADAPSGPFYHWLVWDIPARSTGLPENVARSTTLPDGAVQGTNDFGRPGWAGPCPPRGTTHRYFFRVYALDASLGAPAGAKAADVLRRMRGHVVAQGEVMGVFRH